MRLIKYFSFWAINGTFDVPISPYKTCDRHCPVNRSRLMGFLFMLKFNNKISSFLRTKVKEFDEIFIYYTYDYYTYSLFHL